MGMSPLVSKKLNLQTKSEKLEELPLRDDQRKLFKMGIVEIIRFQMFAKVSRAFASSSIDWIMKSVFS
jgi:hypothetical protein